MKGLKATLGLAMAIIMVLPGCGGSAQAPAAADNSAQAPAATDSSAQAQVATDSSANKAANSGIGDLTEKLSLTIYSSGWVNTPFPADDPFKKYLLDTFNTDVEFIVVPDADMSQKVFTAISAGNDPDFIYYRNKDLLLQLHEQGITVDDHSIYYSSLPTFQKFSTDNMKAATTIDGKMYAMPRRTETSSFETLMYRSDWLDKVGGSVPKTADELLDLMRKFVNNDPNGNGSKDTYAITAAGDNKSIGIWPYCSIFEPVDFYLKNGKLVYYVMEPEFKMFLDFCKTMYDEKLIDPDFYSQGTTNYDAKVYNGSIGIIYSVPLIAIWHENATGNTGANKNTWIPFDCPKGSENGGKYAAKAEVGGYYGIFNKVAKDEKRLNRLLYIIDQCQFPNKPYWALRWGIDIYPNAKLTPFADGKAQFFPQGDDPRAMAGSLWDYGCWIGTDIDKVKYSPKTAPEELDIITVNKENTVLNYPRYTNLSSMVSYDPSVVEDLRLLQEQFAYQYMTGQNTDFDGFISQYKAAGGDAFLAEAEKQLKAIKVID